METKKVTIKISCRTGSEYGYGIYVNGYIDGSIWAWERLPIDASDDIAKAAAKRVRAKARYAFNRQFKLHQNH